MRLRPSHNGMVFLDGALLPLPPKERAALRLLLRACPEPVSKDDFAAEAWDGAEMSDESLARCISQLRRLLPAEAGVSLRAVYGVGYRLAVREGTAAQARRHDWFAAAADADPPLAEAVMRARVLLDSREAAAEEEAERLLRDALAISPDYAPARILLAERLAWSAFCGDAAGVQALREAEGHLATAERVAPRAPGLDAMLGHVLDLQWRFVEAEVRHARAARDHPDDALAHQWRAVHLMMLGRAREAAAAMSRATALNPYSPAMAMTLSHVQLAVGDRAAALETAARTAERHRRSLPAQSFDAAVRAFAAPALGPEAAAVHAAALEAYPFAGPNLSYAFARGGAPEKAMRVLEKPNARDPARAARFLPALIELGLMDEALRRLEAAAAARAPYLPAVLWGAQYAPLRAHPRFRALWSRIAPQSPRTRTRGASSGFNQDRPGRIA